MFDIITRLKRSRRTLDQLGSFRNRGQSSLELVESDSGVQLAKPPSFNSIGLTAQHVRIETRQSYDYQWKGRPHYLALHDLRNIDCELSTQGSSVNHTKDLRGRLTFVPSGCGAWGWAIPQQSPQFFTALYFDPAQMEIDLEKRLRMMPARLLLYFTNTSLRMTLEKIRCELERPYPPDPLYMESLCIVAALELARVQQEPMSPEPRQSGQLDQRRQARVMDYIEAHLTQDICLNDLAAIAGLSRFHFLRAFKRSTHQTPYQYLMLRRLERAESMLAAGDWPVTRVATEVGFKDSTRLIRMFRKIKGITPGAYRKERGL